MLSYAFQQDALIQGNSLLKLSDVLVPIHLRKIYFSFCTNCDVWCSYLNVQYRNTKYFLFLVEDNIKKITLVLLI